MPADAPDWPASRIRALDELLRRHDYRGRDPFDLPNAPLLRWLPESWELPQLVVSKFGSRALPDAGRRLLRVPEIDDPKTLACAYFGHRAAGTPEGDAEAARLVARLVSLAASGPDGPSWGYDFTWPTRSMGVNPRRASTIVPGAFALFALLHDAATTGAGERDLIAQACTHYATRHACRSPEGPYLGYFADAAVNTHNANLLGCAALSLAGRVLGRDDWKTVAADAAATSVGAVGEDGYLPYAAHSSGQWSDCFHHVYVIACTLAIADANPRVDRAAFQSAAERMTGYLRRSFLRDDGLLNYFPGRLHPIDPHNYAATAIFVALLGARPEVDLPPEAGRELLRRVDELMWDPGRERYLFRRHPRRTDRRFFMRWTQAWMFAALSIAAAGDDAGRTLLVGQGARA